MSDTKPFDPWQTTSGLPLADADVTIAKVEFITDNTIGAGVIVAKVTYTLDETGEEAEQKYSIGSGWRVIDRGNAVEPENGGPRGFNNQTNWGIFIDGAIAAAEKSGVLAGLRQAVEDPRVASSWVGIGGHMIEKTRMVTKGKNSDEKVESRTFVFGTVVLPTGEAPAAGAAKAAAPAAKAAAGKKAPAKKGAALDDDQKARLVTIAEHVIETEGLDHGLFMAAALGEDDVASSPVMTKAVMDDGAGSLWAEVAAQYEEA